MTQTNVYDLVVVGGTSSGIGAAAHAARRGLSACLVTLNGHLGAMMASGLGRTNTYMKYRHGARVSRAPLLDEFYDAVEEHYRETYGEDSQQFEDCEHGYAYEPHVAESIFDEMVASEESLTVLEEYHPIAVERDGREINGVTLRSFTDAEEERAVRGDAFVDATYEGDLAAVAGVPYRVGRESRWEFDEQYAGRIFQQDGKLYTGSTGEGDDAIQGYNYRDLITCDPGNRRCPEKPDNYDRSEYLPTPEEEVEAESNDPVDSRLVPIRFKNTLTEQSVEQIRENGLTSWMGTSSLPNEKESMNIAEIYGGADDYPEADWERREEIAKRHRDHALGLLYFLQNDDAVPGDVQEEALEWGLPKDEFQDNDNYPWQFYVREARRIEGREVFTEHDARVAGGISRSPVNETAVAIAEFPLDVHGCRPVRRPQTGPEGGFKLDELTLPSQIPYGTLLPEELDNLLVPVALSATHVGFGTIRMEPTWMQLGEAAGVACALAAQRGTSPAELDPAHLQRELAEAGTMLSYFKNHDPRTEEPWVAAVQFLSTKGFFDTYEVRPDDALERGIAREWAQAVAEFAVGDLDATRKARRVAESDGTGDEPVEVGELLSVIDRELRREGVSSVDGVGDSVGLDADSRCSRGEACLLAYEAMALVGSE